MEDFTEQESMEEFSSIMLERDVSTVRFFKINKLVCVHKL